MHAAGPIAPSANKVHTGKLILLIACGVPNALALAFFGGVADVLPFVGIFLTMVPAVLASLSQGLVVTMIVLVVMLC